MAAHATTSDLVAWLPAGSFPDDPDRVLDRASELVDQLVRAAYDTDDSGAATDATVAAALRDATCAVVESWLEVGEANDVDGLAGQRVAIDGYSGPRAPSVSPRARRVLVAAGLCAPNDRLTVWP